MIAYKLLRQRRDGSLGPLFINQRQRIPIGVLLQAEAHRTKGYAFRPGWHCLAERRAPHLSERGRVWCRVEIADFEEFRRPEAQGGKWFLAQQMIVLEVLAPTQQQQAAQQQAAIDHLMPAQRRASENLDWDEGTATMVAWTKGA